MQSELFPMAKKNVCDDIDKILADRNSLGVRIERELWTSRQRQGHSLHEVSYRACFKSQLPQFFIQRLTKTGDRVYDPFSGRGTTVVEAALMGRRVVANDINPISAIFSKPRISPPLLHDIAQRLDAIDVSTNPITDDGDPDLSPFYHLDTERELRSLREYLLHRRMDRTEDRVDRWLRMVATNRLTGHSPGFFSIYTLPPNQAITSERQRGINARLAQIPPYREIKGIILKKSKQLLRDLSVIDSRQMANLEEDAVFLTGRAQETCDRIPSHSVALTVTSPPFLDVVQYAEDNWLRCWFNHIDVNKIGMAMSTSRSVDIWAEDMRQTLQELYRVTRVGGHVAFEVGEVRGGKIKLDEVIEPLGESVGFVVKAVLINAQTFTKTSNIWGVSNNRKGTNTNRIVLFRKE
ncbi:MAG: DNA methyltransferase [Rhodocyclaceae bacterium]|nr:DNA methyltransferase [Rhodocyclaceae bacterium]